MNKKQFAIIAVLIICVFLIPILFYIWKFHNYSISNNPLEWGSFGEYIQGTSVAILAFVGLFISYAFNIISERRNQNALIQQQRAHRPLGFINASDFENEIAVSLKNSGLGPLLITNFKAINSRGEIENSVIDWMPVLPKNITWGNFFGNPIGYVIEVGSEVELIKIGTENINYDGNEVAATMSQNEKFNINAFSETRDDIRKALSDLTIELEYEDIYGNKMPIVSRKLDWFKRFIY